jgi:hypothetical protein
MVSWSGMVSILDRIGFRNLSCRGKSPRLLFLCCNNSFCGQGGGLDFAMSAPVIVVGLVSLLISSITLMQLLSVCSWGEIDELINIMGID